MSIMVWIKNYFFEEKTWPGSANNRLGGEEEDGNPFKNADSQKDKIWFKKFSLQSLQFFFCKQTKMKSLPSKITQ